MPKLSAVFGIGFLFLAGLCVPPSFASAQSVAAVADSGPDAEVKEFRLDELAASLRTMKPGPERDYFAGVLANRENHLADSIRLLRGSLPGIRIAHPARAAVALEALADDYTKSFQYAEAARAYDDLLTHFSGQLKPEELQGTKDDAGVAHILSGAPAQTISWNGPTRLRTTRNPLNSVNAELTVNGVRGPWLLDTGANLSAVSKSFAERLGLKLLPGTAQTQAGLTGIENPLRVAVLPALEMGGATLHNVVMIVLEDASLKVGIDKEKYQIDAIVGYPVFQALGAIRFVREGEFEAGAAVRSSAAGTRMYMKLLAPVIECKVEGQELPFSFDTGASGSNLSLRYYTRFRGESGRWKRGQNKSFGAGGEVTRSIYLQPNLTFDIGARSVTLNRVPIFTSLMGTDIDELYGNLGQDLVATSQSFTLDFTSMTFSLGEPLAKDKAEKK